MLPFQNCPFRFFWEIRNRKCQIYCFDLLSKAIVHAEENTNNCRNSLPVLSAIWTVWKTTAAKHIFGDISNFFFQKWRLEIISVEFSHYSSANFRCWETKKKVFFMIHYPLYNKCHSKKVTKNPPLFLIGYILTWQLCSYNVHVILFLKNLTIQGTT